MPKTAARQSIYDLSKGLNTEANVLGFPAGFTSDELNFDINVNGLRYKRAGIDYETDYEVTSVDFNLLDDRAADVYVFKDVNKIANRNFIVEQIGTTLYFFSTISGEAQSASLVDTVDCSSFVTAANATGLPFVFTAGSGILFVGGEEVSPFYISYDEDTEQFSATGITLQIRDFNGVDDSLAIDNRPGTLSDEHNYNLQNQGWSSTDITNFKNGYTNTTTSASESAVAWTGVGTYPSNVDVVFLGKGNFNTSTISVVDVLQPRLLARQILGNTPAAKGHFILNYFNPSRATASGISGLDADDPITARATGLVFAFGRVFYGVSNEILFSQLLQDDVSVAGKCYQDADPTSEHTSDLIATDGGKIILQDAGAILRLELVGRLIVIVATNGVFTLGGTDVDGFNATNFQIQKISKIGGISNTAVLAVGNELLYLSQDGINKLSLDKITLSLVPESLTDNTISTFYTDLSVSAKRYAKLLYDIEAKKVYMLYNNNYQVGQISTLYDSILVYHIQTGGFYPWRISSIDNNGPFISGLFISPSVSSGGELNVVSGTDQCTVNGDDVILAPGTFFQGSSILKAMVIYKNLDTGKYDITLAEFSSTSFTDWESHDDVGSDYEAYLKTGEIIPDIPQGAGASKPKHIPVVNFYFNATETSLIDDGDGGVVYDHPSSAIATLMFNATDSNNANQWSTAQQVYRLPRAYFASPSSSVMNPGERQIHTKTVFRGTGRTFKMKIQTEARKDCQLLGFDIAITGGTRL